jgi:hypothetical protein
MAKVSLLFITFIRHGRACPGHPRLHRRMKDVDARHKAGHDEGETALNPNRKML